MEPGECSGAKPVEELWAKLVPSDSRYLDVEIRSNEMVVCSEVRGASLHKHEWCKLTRNPDLCTATMQNLSPNAIIVDDIVVEKEMTVRIKSGSEVILGKDSEGCLSYTFTITPTEEQCKKLKISIDVEHAKCSICLNIWHDVVSVAPCLHNFCNGCFSEWLRRSQENHSSVLCPQCRATVQFVGRNHFLHNIEEDILRSDPSFNRSNEEVAVLNAYASIQSNLVIRTCRTPGRKRTYSPPDEDSTSVEFLCPQCGTEYGGFQCSQATVHLQCQSCEGMMPSRTDISVPQHCIGCDRAFCGPYWQSQGLVGSHLALCTRENFKPISERTTSRIPFSTHQNNLYEQDITERCIRQTGKTLQDVLSDWIAKLNNREIDRTRMPLNHAEMINAGTHLCNDCYDKLVSYLLYWFRISFPKYLLPPDASKREDCWYGSACRTQHHNVEHARKRNHVCRPTRGGNM